MEPPIVKLARNVRQCPDDRLALARLVDAVRQDGHAAALATLAEWWAATVAGRPRPNDLLSSLFCQAARHAEPARASELARAALNLCPLDADALAVLEEHLGPEGRDELCEHYRRFLRDAPFQRAAPRIRVRLIDRLLEAGRYDEAAEHVRMLPPRSALRGAEDVASACRVAPETRTARDEPVDKTLILEEVDIEVLWHDDEPPARQSDIRALGPVRARESTPAVETPRAAAARPR